MALTQTREQIRDNVRRFSDTGGTNALVRHPNTDLNDYINRALGSLHRILCDKLPDQRYLSSDSITLVSGTATYALEADFDHLISADLTANGAKHWLVAYEMHERPSITSPNGTTSGVPFAYRLRGSNIEFIPTPSSAGTVVLWYVPTPTQFTQDAGTFDTINRLDDYLIAYASRFIAIKDKNVELVGLCKEMIEELRAEIEAIARNRDKNSPPRPVDEAYADRWGRRRWKR